MTVDSALKVPFGYHKETGLYVGIDEVANGLACNCYCPSCEMRLVARNGEGNDRAHHFAHYRKAKMGCEFSYWVAVRSMAKQIVEADGCGMLDFDGHFLFASVPFANMGQVKVLGWRVEPKIKEYQFDLKARTSHGDFYIHFLTSPEDEGRHLFHRVMHSSPVAFTPYRVLEIDLHAIVQAELKAITTTLKEIIVSSVANNKEWFVVEEPFINIIRRKAEEERLRIARIEKAKMEEEEWLRRQAEQEEKMRLYLQNKKEREKQERFKENAASKPVLRQNGLWPDGISDGYIKTLKNILVEKALLDRNARSKEVRYEKLYKHNFPPVTIVRCFGSYFGIIKLNSFYYYTYKVETDELVPLAAKGEDYMEAVNALAKMMLDEGDSAF